jgi:uncharacterized protein
MPNAVPYLVGSLEIALAISGLVLLWRVGIRPAARRQPAPVLLERWDASPTDFLAFLLLVLGGTFLAATAASQAGKYLPFRGDQVTVFNGAAAQVGMLGGALGYWFGFERGRTPFPIRFNARIVLWGAATFAITLPVLIAAAKSWEFALHLGGFSTEKQDLVGMFANADSPLMLGVMITLAIVIAPLTEELVFRAGLFRYFRTRAPRWVALVVPALIFAVLHVNWKTQGGLASLLPLAVLAVMFSLAYERTGRIGTSMVAHALFNLNTILLIFSGVGM